MGFRASLFPLESVNEGRLEKICNQISDAVLDTLDRGPLQ
jgi:S-adenosylmethionine synthetase